MGIFRGQGATEYLVLLAVVLIVALVSVALLGFFPGMAADARVAQSSAYWRGQARPFAILDNAASGSSVILSVQNVDANSMTLTGIVVGTGAGNATGNLVFGGGETKTISVAIGPTCTSGTIYDQNVTINYTTSSGLVSKEYGTKNLINKCS